MPAKTRIPAFKSEKAEAEWWDAHPEVVTALFPKAKKEGKIKRLQRLSGSALPVSPLACVKPYNDYITPDPDVILKWSLPYREKDDARWHTYGVYAYPRPRHPEILYIGKAAGRTVLQRVHDPDKEAFFRDLAERRSIQGVRVIVAQFGAAQRITHQLILDVESLLIHSIKPWGNIQSTRSRSISRPGVTVKCEGKAWPLGRRTFHDQ